MKIQLLTILAAGIATASVSAQGAKSVKDSIVMGAGYANQVWYSLGNDEQGTSAKNNWDLGFDGVAITSSIHINTPGGAKLWVYPKGNKTAFGTALDTNGLSKLGERYNSPFWWSLGAMGNYADPANGMDLDWGTYDINTHVVSGDSVYIIKLSSGSYKQLFVEKLTGGTWYLKFANIDGSSSENVQVVKSSFTNKNLGYYSVTNKAMVNREPDRGTWDITFTQYTDIVSGMYYPVTGVLANRHHGVKVAQVDRQANAAGFSGWQTQNFDSTINIIGYDWKTHTGGGVYTTKDSTVYFVSINQPMGRDIWRLYFTGFASADGKSVFVKEKLQAASVSDVSGNSATIALYPNPSNGPVQVAYTLEGANNSAMLTVTDLTGKTVLAQQLNNNSGLNTYTIPANTLRSGMYIVSVSTVGGRVQQKLVIN